MAGWEIDRFWKSLLRRFGGRDVSSRDEYGAKKSLGTLDVVVDFLERHSIDPNPTNYELVYRQQISHESGLDLIVDKLIVNGRVEGPLPKNQEAVFESGLSEIADFAHTQLKAIELIVGQSKQDAKGFGDALQQETASVNDNTLDPKFIGSLLSMTRTMINKTRAAEEKLKSREKVVNELQHSLADAKSRADTDALTGLSNRRAFERELGAACERAELGKVELSLAICDIDHFKSINDNYGHVTGDRVLQLVGEILRENCDAYGQVFRFGGEEFVILCEGYTANDTEMFVEASRLDLVSRKIVKKETKQNLEKLSFSTGICEYKHAGSAEALLKLADKSLYKAKANGRNLTLIAGNS